MKLRDLLLVVETPVTLDLSGVLENYASRCAVPESLLEHEVRTLEAVAGAIVIRLDPPKKVPTLEELGYSFEAGV
jgi:hypothetical protein